MDCCCGLNTIVSVPVPGADGEDGDPVDVSTLQGRKTIEVSGSYDGSYSISGSHDGSLFFPVASFSSGAGPQTIRKTIDVVASVFVVHRNAPRSGVVTINLAARIAPICVPTHGRTFAPNQFAPLAALLPGALGPQPAIDLLAVVPNGLDSVNVACGGSFAGQISIEASLDGANFSPVGSFLSSRTRRGEDPGQEVFDPLLVGNTIRFIRANILPGTTITGPTSLTLGGVQNCDCSNTPPPTPPPPGPPVGTRFDLTFEALINVPDGGLGSFRVIGMCMPPDYAAGVWTFSPNWLMSQDEGSGFPVVPQYGLEWWGCDGTSGTVDGSHQYTFLGGHTSDPQPPGTVLTAGLHHLTYRRSHTGNPFISPPLLYTIDVFIDGVLVATADASQAAAPASSLLGTPRFTLGGLYATPAGVVATTMVPMLTCRMATARLINYARSDADIAADAAWTLAGNLHPVIPTTVGLWQLQSDTADSGPNGIDMMVITGVQAFTGLGGGSPLQSFNFDNTRCLWTNPNALLKCVT